MILLEIPQSTKMPGFWAKEIAIIENILARFNLPLIFAPSSYKITHEDISLAFENKITIKCLGMFIQLVAIGINTLSHPDFKATIIDSYIHIEYLPQRNKKPLPHS